MKTTHRLTHGCGKVFTEDLSGKGSMVFEKWMFNMSRFYKNVWLGGNSSYPATQLLVNVTGFLSLGQYSIHQTIIYTGDQNWGEMIFQFLTQHNKNIMEPYSGRPFN